MLNEPTNAWRFYICNDHPKDKATYHYSFTVPASFVPAGSGDLLKIEEATGTVIFPGKSFERDYDPGTNEGTVTFTYALETQTAPYLFTVCAGAFDLKLQTFDTGRVQLDFVDINHKDASHAWELTGLQEEIIASLEPFFGKYPYTNSGAIVFHTEMGAALETLGRSLYDASTTEDFVFAHEITHQWMGDLISLEDWSDLWIKEGAATFGELLWAEHKDGRKAYEDEVILNYKTVVSHGSSGPKEIHSNQPDDLYSAGPYKGGSLVYHILRDRLGDEVFSKALQTLIEENKYGTVNEEKFIEVFSRVSGEDLTDLIKSFLYYGENGHVPDLPGLITYEEAMKEYEESTKKEV